MLYYALLIMEKQILIQDRLLPNDRYYFKRSRL